MGLAMCMQLCQKDAPSVGANKGISMVGTNAIYGYHRPGGAIRGVIVAIIGPHVVAWMEDGELLKRLKQSFIIEGEVK